jgi:ketosteroid isomerase-like protein
LSAAEHAKDLVRSYFAAVNDERWDDVVELFDDRATVYVPSVRPKQGKERIRRFYESIGTSFLSHEASIVFLIAEGDRAAATIRYDGVSTDGRPVVVHATDTFTFEDGRIRELRIVFDTADSDKGEPR